MEPIILAVASLIQRLLPMVKKIKNIMSDDELSDTEKNARVKEIVDRAEPEFEKRVADALARLAPQEE